MMDHYKYGFMLKLIIKMIILVIFFILIIIYLFSFIKTKFSLPNGPLGLPYFGYSLFLGSPLFKTLHDLSLKYGKMYSFTAFGKNILVLNDYYLIKEALLKRKEFSGRTTLFVNGTLAEKKGISNFDGPSVDIKRKLIHNYLKMNDNFEGIIDNETTHFIEHISQFTNLPVYSRKLFNKAVCNIIWTIIFGRRIDYDDAEALSNVEKVALNNSENDVISFKQFIPSIFSTLFSKTETLRRCFRLEQIFKRYHTVIDFLKISPKHEEFDFNIENEGNQKISEMEKLRLIFELFAAGTDTIILTLQWSILLLSIHPEEQEKMREEIKQTILSDINGKVFISWNERNKLRYCQQVITEVHRVASVTPLALPHRVTKTCTLGKYQIPEDTVVLLGIYFVHHDPEVWTNPNQFTPSRFNNKSLVENIIPFSLGARTCPGSSLAQAEIFSILLNIIYNFKLTAVKENLSIKDLGIGTAGLTRAPAYHEVIFTKIVQ